MAFSMNLHWVNLLVCLVVCPIGQISLMHTFQVAKASRGFATSFFLHICKLAFVHGDEDDISCVAEMTVNCRLSLRIFGIAAVSS